MIKSCDASQIRARGAHRSNIREQIARQGVRSYPPLRSVAPFRPYPLLSNGYHALSVGISARHVRSCITTADTLNDPLPDTTAAERLSQHLAELARIQRIGKVGGLEVDFREGFKNRRSPEYLMLHGLPADATDESHEDWVNRIHPDDRDAAVKHFFEALSGTNEDYTAEYRIIRPSDGETRWIRVVAKIERDSDGRAIRLVGAHIDVTDQMLVRETLRASAASFRLIADG